MDAHSREDVICRKRPRSARECAQHIPFLNNACWNFCWNAEIPRLFRYSVTQPFARLATVAVPPCGVLHCCVLSYFYLNNIVPYDATQRSAPRNVSNITKRSHCAMVQISPNVYTAQWSRHHQTYTSCNSSTIASRMVQISTNRRFPCILSARDMVPDGT